MTASFVVAVVTACSKPAGETSPATSASATTLPQAVAPAFDIEGFCEKVMALPAGRKCNADDEVREQNKIGYCGTLLREIRDGGRASFDAAAAKSCIAAVAAGDIPLPDSRTLQDLGVRLAACRKVIVGKQGAGAACKTSVECAKDLVCHQSKCLAALGVGKECAVVREVGLAGVTSTCTVEHDCIESRCVARPKAASGAAGAPCAADLSCAAGLFCSANKPRTCQPRQAAGQKCTASTQCRGRCSKADGICTDYCGSG